ncbi:MULTISPECIES: EVE domain-containing protein [Nocardiaceae]|uniref:EVE domain-containing protein n=1 Tax=Nocardiaceae TaxID=85025 RepID=UPI000B266B51|nr:MULTISPECIES: EVE domain-containing protein [Rhodococcus]
MTTRAITNQTLGAWVIKCNPHKTDLAPMVEARRAHENWCVADNYRTRLMAPGQPVLFWVSSHPRRGIWGAGRLTGTPVPGPQWKVPTNIALFDAPILASDIQCVEELSMLEVFRSPQQSNPSWIDATAWAAIRPMLPVIQ